MEELDLNKANDAIGEYKASEYQDWLDLEPEPTRQMLEASHRNLVRHPLINQQSVSQNCRSVRFFFE